MNLSTYLKSIGKSANAFAAIHNIPAATAWRAANEKPVKPHNALRIEQATGGAVTRMELLYPDQKGEGAETR
jgi:DNA-binding transcriptional regulator YdaS (Cro superfamily)